MNSSLIFCLIGCLALATAKPFFPFYHPTPVVYSAPYAPYAPYAAAPTPYAAAPTPYAAVHAPHVAVRTVESVATPFFNKYHAQAADGSYSFGYSGGPSSRAETKNQFGVVQGAFNYIDPTGKVQSQQYVADAGGFRVAATNLPLAPVVAHHVPVEDTAEVKAAKAEFHRIYNSRVKRDADPAFLTATGYQSPASTVPISSHTFVPGTHYVAPTPVVYKATDIHTPVPITYKVPSAAYPVHHSTPFAFPYTYPNSHPFPTTYGAVAPPSFFPGFNFKNANVYYTNHPSGVQSYKIEA